MSGLISAVVCLAGACGPELIEVSAADIQGDWSNAAGATLHFQDDRTFKASHLDKAGVDPAFCPELPRVDQGQWMLFRSLGDGGYMGDPVADQGFGISLATGSLANCSLLLSTYGDTDAPTMCLVIDPDSTCSGREEFHRDNP